MTFKLLALLLVAPLGARSIEMPRYGILQSHSPDICPITNKTVRDFAKKAFPKMDEVAKKHGVKVLSYDHLDPDHRAFMVLEAKSAEDARDFLFEAGFAHFVRMEFFLLSPVADLLKNVDEIPVLYK